MRQVWRMGGWMMLFGRRKGDDDARACGEEGERRKLIDTTIF